MYCIMRTEKRKRQDIGGLQRENNRTATEYNNQVQPGMDILNVDLLHSDNWMQDIQQEIDRAGARTRSNSVVALDTIYTASGDFFKGKSNEENDQFFRDCLEFHQRKFGHVISAVIHYDETTAHMHVRSARSRASIFRTLRERRIFPDYCRRLSRTAAEQERRDPRGGGSACSASGWEN